MNSKDSVYHLTLAVSFAVWGYFFGNEFPGYVDEAFIVLTAVVVAFFLYLWVPLLYKMSKHVEGFDE